MYTKSIKNIRKQLNMTQMEFAKLIGASVETVRCWEQGKRGIATKNGIKVLKICQKYNLDALGGLL